jgi:hypothetical protein
MQNACKMHALGAAEEHGLRIQSDDRTKTCKGTGPQAPTFTNECESDEICRVEGAITDAQRG